MRSVKCLIATLSLTTALLSGTLPAQADWILPPEAAPAVTRALSITATPDRLGLLRSATLDKTSIKVTVRRSDTVVMELSLVHPTAAPQTAFRAAGVALVERPGPVDKAALKAIKASLSAASTPVPWRQLAAAAPETDPEALQSMEQILRQTRYLKSAGDLKEARAHLETLPDALPPHVALRTAVLWMQLEAPKAAKATLSGLGEGTSVYDVAARAIGGEKAEPDALLKGRDEAAACQFTELTAALVALGRPLEARALAERVLKRAPSCQAAWESALHRRLEARDFKAAMGLAKAALEAFSLERATDGLLSTIASAHVAVESYVEAARLLEFIARRTPSDESVVRVLLSAMLRDADVRANHTERLEKAHAAKPDDIITSFLLGIIYHYANRFEESTALLAPLEEVLGHQGRLHIYLAMNDFNLGKTAPALERLDRAALREDPDPDVFYCRAEILRDTRREQARSDLARYDAMSKGSHMSNPEKNARVGQMIKDLDGCLETNPLQCESLWEHPRIKESPKETKREKAPVDDTPWWPRLLGGFALLTLIAVVLKLGRGRREA